MADFFDTWQIFSQILDLLTHLEEYGYQTIHEFCFTICIFLEIDHIIIIWNNFFLAPNYPSTRFVITEISEQIGSCNGIRYQFMKISITIEYLYNLLSMRTLDYLRAFGV